MLSDQLGLVFVLILVGATLVVLASAPIPRGLRAIICLGLVLRVGGALARYAVLFGLYHGSGDARGYYRTGLTYAERFRAFDFSPLWDASQWTSQNWYGTQFISFPSGFVLAIIGPTMLGEFIVFSLFAFVGLVSLVVAFRRAFPEVPSARYAAWILLFPSLWYWPSSVGKESIMVLGIGLTTLGFVGRHGRMKLLPLLGGLAIVICVRPEVAAVFVLCAAMVHLLTGRGGWTFGRVLQGGITLAIGLTTILYAGREVGIDSFDAEGLEEFVTANPARAVGGGSSIEAVPVGWSAPPLAAINVLMRPFPWEVHNAMMALSSLEITGLCLLLLWRRRSVVAAVRNWRRSRFISFALAFSLIYAIALGMMMSNLAIIARQRIFIFPFLFLLMEACAATQRLHASRASVRAVPIYNDRLVVTGTARTRT
jgi:hypothetical protein